MNERSTKGCLSINCGYITMIEHKKPVTKMIFETKGLAFSSLRTCFPVSPEPPSKITVLTILQTRPRSNRSKRLSQKASLFAKSATKRPILWQMLGGCNIQLEKNHTSTLKWYTHVQYSKRSESWLSYRIYSFDLSYSLSQLSLVVMVR